MEILFPNRIPFHMNHAKHFLNIKLKFMSLMKYIINKNGPILFPENVPHETFAPVMGEIQSAGYCSFWFSSETQSFECFTLPEIDILGIGATSMDYIIIEQFLNDKK